MKRSAIAFWFASASMDVCCLCAWSALLLQVGGQGSYGFAEACAVFALGSLVSSLGHRSGWVSSRIAAVNAAILSLLGLRDGVGLWYASETLWSAAAHFGWTLAFWIGGVRHSRRSQRYSDVCAHFDLSLGWMFGLSFIELMLSLRNDVQVVANDSSSSIFPFFFFGLVSVTLARNRSAEHRSFMSGYRGIGLLTGFGAAVVLTGTALALLCMPYLRAASELGYQGLSKIGRPVADRVAQGVLYLMAVVGGRLPPPELPRHVAPESNTGDANSLPSIGSLHDSPSESWIMFALVSIILLVPALWVLWRWLSAPRARADSPVNVWERLREWLERMRLLIANMIAQRKRTESLRLYGALLRWGRRCGVPKHPSDTPLEYGQRLKDRLAVVTSEIDLIVSTFNAHVYGQALTDQNDMARARTAWRRLQSPSLWPRRLRLWLSA